MSGYYTMNMVHKEGFLMIELMVALMVGMVVMGACIGALVLMQRDIAQSYSLLGTWTRYEKEGGASEEQGLLSNNRSTYAIPRLSQGSYMRGYRDSLATSQQYSLISENGITYCVMQEHACGDAL